MVELPTILEVRYRIARTTYRLFLISNSFLQPSAIGVQLLGLVFLIIFALCFLGVWTLQAIPWETALMGSLFSLCLPLINEKDPRGEFKLTTTSDSIQIRDELATTIFNSRNITKVQKLLGFIVLTNTENDVSIIPQNLSVEGSIIQSAGLARRLIDRWRLLKFRLFWTLQIVIALLPSPIVFFFYYQKNQGSLLA